MDVILLERVKNLGNVGDKVAVRPGYGRNFLIPTGKAAAATAANLAAFEERRADLEAAAAESLSAAEARRDKLTDLAVTIVANSGNEGKLFGSVGAAEIADAITAAGVEVGRREVRLPNGPLRNIGEFAIELHLHSDVDVDVNITVVAGE
ncbi:MAG: 50S ribosomal protein L9 [Gammaproteobacteria bacterium]|nr:50S ribosomal protein L9 [Gammaproteobacteria bacterium]MCP5135959.1 50S ribosomal protein L9 [Gammaproteobacteria bacterium]